MKRSDMARKIEAERWPYREIQEWLDVVEKGILAPEYAYWAINTASFSPDGLEVRFYCKATIDTDGIEVFKYDELDMEPEEYIKLWEFRQKDII